LWKTISCDYSLSPSLLFHSCSHLGTRNLQFLAAIDFPTILNITDCNKLQFKFTNLRTIFYIYKFIRMNPITRLWWNFKFKYKTNNREGGGVLKLQFCTLYLIKSTVSMQLGVRWCFYNLFVYNCKAHLQCRSVFR